MTVGVDQHEQRVAARASGTRGVAPDGAPRRDGDRGGRAAPGRLRRRRTADRQREPGAATDARAPAAPVAGGATVAHRRGPGRRRHGPRRRARWSWSRSRPRASSRRSPRSAPTRVHGGRREDGRSTAGCHGSQFSIEDGSRSSGPATEPLAAKKVTVEGEESSSAEVPAVHGMAARSMRARRVGPWPTRRRTARAPGSIPTSPGVYRFRDAQRRVVYVGKAKNLRSRLTSYFQDIANLHPRTATMVTTAASVEWTVVGTEVEALQLEYSWIKEYDPRFNVKYRDDKSYPWLAVTLGEEFPRVMVGRGAKKRGHPLLRPLLPRLGDPRDRRPAAAGVPDAVLLQRRVQALGADRPARACWATSASARRRAWAGSPPRSTARSSTTSATSWPAAPRPSSSASRRRCTPPPPTRTTSAPPGSATTSARSTGRWRSRRSCWATAPTPTSSRFSEDPLEVAVQIFYVRGGRIRGQRGWVADKVDDADTGGLVERLPAAALRR